MNFTDTLLTVAGKMQANKVLSSIKNAFIDNMPVTICGAFCTLFQFVISTHAEGYISLANVPGLEFLTAITPIWSTANYGCMNFMAVAICFLVSWHYAENCGRVGDKTAPAVALATFVTLITTSVTGTVTTEAGEEVEYTVNSVVANTYTNSQGLFVGLIVGILATLFYCKLVNSGKLSIKLPDSVPPNVSASFAVLFPAVIVIMGFSTLNFALTSLTGLTFFNLITTIMAPLRAIMTGLPGYLVVVFLMCLLWCFGIHGPNVMSAVTTAFMTQAYAENNAAYAAGEPIPNIICTTFGAAFFSLTGSGITGGFIIAVFLFSKRDDYKAICRLAIPCGIFNINEPIIFGIPVVMNPIMMVPFILAPLASVTVAYIMTAIGICPRMVVDAPWTTPFGIMAFLASGGHLMGGLQQVISVAISTLIYTPFVIAANRMGNEEAVA